MNDQVNTDAGSGRPQPWAVLAVLWLWALLVVLQSVFSGSYTGFLLHLSARGDISASHFAAMCTASILLVIGGLMTLTRFPARLPLALAALCAVAALWLGVWYHMITCGLLALAGVLIETWPAPRARAQVQASLRPLWPAVALAPLAAVLLAVLCLVLEWFLAVQSYDVEITLSDLLYTTRVALGVVAALPYAGLTFVGIPLYLVLRRFQLHRPWLLGAVGFALPAGLSLCLAGLQGWEEALFLGTGGAMTALLAWRVLQWRRGAGVALEQ